VTGGDQVAVPARHGFGANQQLDLTEYGAGQSVQQRSDQRPVSGGESDSLAMRLALEDHDLVAEGENFGILCPVAHR
jgi:hypothetical protein